MTKGLKICQPKGNFVFRAFRTSLHKTDYVSSLKLEIFVWLAEITFLTVVRFLIKKLEKLNLLTLINLTSLWICMIIARDYFKTSSI